MKGKLRRKKPESIVPDGQPVAVILDIDHYQELLEPLEDVEDLQILTAMRKKTASVPKVGGVSEGVSGACMKFI